MTDDMTFAVVLHVIAATPPTLAAIAALMAARHTKRNTQRIIVAVNGEREQMRSELAEMRKQLARKAR